jgi:hypothetical protein
LLIAALLLLTGSVPDADSAQPLPRYRNGRIAFAHLQQVAPPGLATIGANGARRSLILGGHVQEPAVLSPDGNRVACVVGASAPSLYVVRGDGTHRVRIGAGRSPTWAPDGSRIAFVTDRFGEIAVAAADGSGVRSLGVAGLEPVWSPSGGWIAFFTSDNALELIRPDGSGRTVLATDAYPSLDFIRLAWSHDGRWLSFGAVNSETNVLELNVMRPDGSDRRSLANGSGVAWSPTEDAIAFYTSIDGIGTFEIVTPDGIVRMSSQDPWGTPVWSPDGALWLSEIPTGKASPSSMLPPARQETSRFAACPRGRETARRSPRFTDRRCPSPPWREGAPASSHGGCRACRSGFAAAESRTSPRPGFAASSRPRRRAGGLGSCSGGRRALRRHRMHSRRSRGRRKGAGSRSCGLAHEGPSLASYPRTARTNACSHAASPTRRPGRRTGS